ncbi:hypothetical protein [Rubritalea tangerina]|uniref:hypothetical protein n=1 Tax=Rubritalea tangerina TaxID=430798 RepID=UPI00361A844B
MPSLNFYSVRRLQRLLISVSKFLSPCQQGPCCPQGYMSPSSQTHIYSSFVYLDKISVDHLYGQR